MHADDLPQCTVGLHVDKAGSTIEPGVITDVDTAQGTYFVHYDNSTMEEWMGAKMLSRSCVGIPSGAKSLSFFFGGWDEVHLRGELDLVIHPDHSYEWLVDLSPQTILRGAWHEASPDQLDSRAVGPGIVLENGQYEQDWVIQSEGDVDNNNREQILATDANRDYYYFFRAK